MKPKPLPWTPQQHAQRFGPGPHLLTAKDGSQALCGGPGVCPACDGPKFYVTEVDGTGRELRGGQEV